MKGNLENIRQSSIVLPIATAALWLAKEFSDRAYLAGVITEAKKDRIYFNTLAVFAVRDYMEMMDVPIDLNASDSWNSAMRLYTDAADLKLTQLGHLECRPVQLDVKLEKFCDIPLEVPDDRIGLVAVELDTARKEATLLGFMKTAIAGNLKVDKLQSIDKLLEHLDYLERRQKPVQLHQWLHNIFDASWQAVEDILVSRSPSLAFRHNRAIVRGKIIHLTGNISERALATVDCLPPKSHVWREATEATQSVALLVAIEPITETETNIKVQVH
ncbi:MAG: DUF1822 family protein, partial [Microcoleus sp.]